MGVLLYFLAFLVGVFTTWRIGRTRYYDEDRLIDLVVYSTLVGVISGLLFFWAAGLVNFSAKGGPASGWQFSITDRASGYIGVAAAVAFAVYYIKRLRWSLWPTLGFLWLGASAAMGTLAVLSFALPLTLNIYHLTFISLTFLLAYYIVVGGGEAWLKKRSNNLRQRLSSWRSA